MDGKIVIEINAGKYPTYTMQGKITAQDMLVVANNIKKHYRSVYIPALQKELRAKQKEAIRVKESQVAVEAVKAKIVAEAKAKAEAAKPDPVKQVVGKPAA